MAQLMTYGEAEVDIRAINVNRFLPYQTTQRFIDISASKVYREMYDLRHPGQTSSAPRNVRLTPFYAHHQALKAKFIPNAGLELPYWFAENQRLLEPYSERVPRRSGWGSKYWSPIQGAEHLATRENVAMFDLGSLSIIEIAGAGAVDFLNFVCTGKMDIPVGRVRYTLYRACDERQLWLQCGQVHCPSLLAARLCATGHRTRDRVLIGTLSDHCGR